MKLIISAVICMTITDANRLLQSSSCATIRCSTGGPCFDNPHTQLSICCPSDTICSNQDYYTDTTSVICADGNLYDNKCYAYCAFQDINSCESAPTQSLCKCDSDRDCKTRYQCRETPDGFGGCERNVTDSCYGFCVAKGDTCGGYVGMALCRQNEQCIITRQFPTGGIGYCASLPRQCDRRVGCAEDAKICGDGSVVVRVEPYCQFEECPNECGCLFGESCYETSKGSICCDPMLCEGGNGCGGITGETCKPGYECVSDPNSACDISEPECGGVCIFPQRWLPGTSTENPSTTTTLEQISTSELNCGGFENCESYIDGCNQCVCNDFGADVCTFGGLCAAKARCTLCKTEYSLNTKGKCVEPMHCTADAMECSDGSFVGRDPLNDCEFRDCPLMCGGFENCAAYTNGCNECFCGKNGASDVCIQRQCTLSKLESPPACIRCDFGYDLYNGECIKIPTPPLPTLHCPCPLGITKCCDDGFGGVACCSISQPETSTSTTTSTTTIFDMISTESEEFQCCDPNEYPFRCFEGIECCPDGSWSCSIGDGSTYPCGNTSLIFGEDSFGAQCTDVCPTGQCLDRNGECGDIIFCAFSHPCEIETCPIGHSCEVDYCGGCNAVWKDMNGTVLTAEECGIGSTETPETSTSYSVTAEDRVVCESNWDCESGYKCKADPQCLAENRNQGMGGGCWEDKVCMAQWGTCKVWDMECATGYECVLISDQSGFCVKYQ